MKKILFILLAFYSFSTLAAAPASKNIEREMIKSLTGVSKVEVLKVKRRWQFLLTCVLSPAPCMDGRREYRIEVRLTTNEYGDLDYTCDLNHFFRKKYMNVVKCIGFGQDFSITNFTEEDSSVPMRLIEN